MDSLVVEAVGELKEENIRILLIQKVNTGSGV